MLDGPNLRWIWVTSDEQWGELDQLWIVDADDPMIGFLDHLNAEGTPEGVTNIAKEMGMPLAAIVPPLPRDRNNN